MEDFAITIVLLSFYGGIIGAVLWILGKILPETLQDRLWNALGLNIDDLPPYDHTDDED